jgi:hypothetical protein
MSLPFSFAAPAGTVVLDVFYDASCLLLAAKFYQNLIQDDFI